MISSYSPPSHIFRISDSSKTERQKNLNAKIKY